MLRVLPAFWQNLPALTRLGVLMRIRFGLPHCPFRRPAIADLAWSLVEHADLPPVRQPSRSILSTWMILHRKPTVHDSRPGDHLPAIARGARMRFPVCSPRFPGSHQKIPVSISQGISHLTVGNMGYFLRPIGRSPLEFTKFPVLFPDGREFDSRDRFDPHCIHHHAFTFSADMWRRAENAH